MKLDRLTSAQAPAGGDRNDSDASRADDRPPLRAVGRETVLLGRVWSGYGVAGKQLRSFSPELEALTGEVLFEGSLNVLLPEPVQFYNASRPAASQAASAASRAPSSSQSYLMVVRFA